MSEDYRFIGKPTPRKDALAIVTGKAKYIDDITKSDMLYGMVLRCPYPHAEIRKITTDKAEALTGIAAVLTYKDVPDWKAGMPRHVPVLAKRLRYVGDAVAIVAGETREIAKEGLELIDVEYEQLLPVYDMEEAIQSGAPQFTMIFPETRCLNFPHSARKQSLKLFSVMLRRGLKRPILSARRPMAMRTYPIPFQLSPRV